MLDEMVLRKKWLQLGGQTSTHRYCTCKWPRARARTRTHKRPITFLYLYSLSIVPQGEQPWLLTWSMTSAWKRPNLRSGLIGLETSSWRDLLIRASSKGEGGKWGKTKRKQCADPGNDVSSFFRPPPSTAEMARRSSWGAEVRKCAKKLIHIPWLSLMVTTGTVAAKKKEGFSESCDPEDLSTLL